MVGKLPLFSSVGRAFDCRSINCYQNVAGSIPATENIDIYPLFFKNCFR